MEYVLILTMRTMKETRQFPNGVLRLCIDLVLEESPGEPYEIIGPFAAEHDAIVWGNANRSGWDYAVTPLKLPD